MSINEQQLMAANQQLIASEQQLKAANQQLMASEQQLRATNQQLTISDARYRAMFEKMSSAVAVYEVVEGGKDFVITSFNPAAERAEDIKDKDVIGRSLLEVFPGVKKFGLFDVLVRVWKTGVGEHFPVAIYHDDRVSGWKDNFVYKLPSGEVVAIYDDVTERVQTQLDLRQSEEKYRSIFETAPNLITSVNKDGIIIDCNEHAIEVLGYEKHELVGTSFFKIIHPDYLLQAQSYLEKILNSNSKQEKDFKMVCRNGGIIDVIISSTALSNEKGNRTRALCVISDITERVQSEQRIRESEERFRLLYERSPLGYQSLDSKGCFIEVNKAWLEMLGYQREEVIGHSFAEFITQGHSEKFKKNFPRFKSTGEIRGILFEVIKKDGGKVLVEIDGKIGYDKDGNFKQTHCVLRDVTQNKQAEAAIQTLVESTVGSTEQEFFDNVTKNLCKWLGVECAAVGQLTGDNKIKTLSMRLEGKQVDTFYCTLEGTPCGKVMQSGYQIYPKNVTKLFPASKYLVDMNAEGYAGTALHDKNGKAIGIIFIVSKSRLNVPDRTREVLNIIGSKAVAEIERMQAQKEMNKHQSELSHASRLTVMGQMATTLAHELNQPLTAISSLASASANILKSHHSGIDEDVLDAIKEINQQALRAGKIIRRIRGFVSKKEPIQTTADINQITREAVAFVEAAAKQKESEIRVKFADKNRKVFVDTIQIEQVLLNLLQNSLDAMEGTKNSKRIIEVNVDNFDKSSIVVSVSDTGKGFDNARADNIFDAFFTTKSKGLGVGLSISQAIIEAHGGHLWATANPQGGATFQFTLPTERRK